MFGRFFPLNFLEEFEKDKYEFFVFFFKFIYFYFFLLLNFYFYFTLLCNTVLVLPYIDMNPPRVYMRSQVFECSVELASEAVGPGLLVIRSFVITVSISLSISLFRFFFRIQSYRLYGSRNVSISSGLFNFFDR